MTQATGNPWRVYAWGAMATLAIPPLVFAASGVGAGMGLAGTASALVAQYATHRHNLLLLALPSLAPIGLLVLLMWVYRRRAGAAAARPVAIGGLLGILAVTVWINTMFWPHFLPSRSYPGFPHGLEFVIGPVLFAPVGMLLGMAIGVAASRRAVP